MKNEDVLYSLVESGEWKIDEMGRVWKTYRGELIRVEHQTPQGYLQVRKMRNGIRLHTGAHRLVWIHFNGSIPDGMVINHKNGIKDNNRPKNLEIVTPSKNMHHAFLTGLKQQWGETNPAAKLTDAQVEEIRNIYAAGNITQASLADQYSVSFQTISKIVRGERRRKQKGQIADYTQMRQRSIKRNELGQFTK